MRIEQFAHVGEHLPSGTSFITIRRGLFIGNNPMTQHKSKGGIRWWLVALFKSIPFINNYDRRNWYIRTRDIINGISDRIRGVR